MQSKPKTSELVRTKLPWIAAGIMLVIYLVTINQWVSIRSLPIVAKVTGWDWIPPQQFPLFYLLTYPFRFLPAAWQPISLNIFSAVCAAATIWILVRSVGLLPHDRTEEQRIRVRSSDGLLNTSFAWAPAALAAAVLGLELTMWENATAATNESLNLLVFAYLIRCLLEFRVSKNERWLTKLALVYGLGVTNNWALIGYFPFFVAGLIWVKGKSFLNASFIVRMMALGLTGMLLYTVLPLVWSARGGEDISFFEALRSTLVMQKMAVFNTPGLRARALILSLTSVLPVLIMFIKFPSGFGDVHSSGAMITNVMFRTIHLVFAGVCIWVAFDQKFSPRQVGQGQPFLSFYYLSALAVGYYIGYLMFVHNDPPKRAYRIVSPIEKLLNPIVQTLAWAAVVIVPLALFYKNFKVTLSENGKVLQDFAALVASEIPQKPAILLSDDSQQLGLMEAWYSRLPGGNPHILVNTRALPLPLYHRELVRRYGSRWPAGGASENPRTRIEPVTLITAVAALAKSNSVYYLHPSFGYFFEAVYGEPRGLAMELKPYSTNMIYPPRLTPALAATNHNFWENARSLVDRTKAMSPLKVADGEFVGRHLSRGLNKWGVELERIGNFSNAAPAFEMAILANSNNLPAQINLDFNERYRSGSTNTDLKLDDPFGNYRSWSQFLSENGPIDAPEYLYPQGFTMLQESLVRQSADAFARAAELAPTNLAPRMALANALIRGRWLDEASKLMARLHNDPHVSQTNKLELIAMEAAMEFSRKDTNRAETILLQAMEKYPNGNFFDSLHEMYQVSGQWDKAVKLFGRRIDQYPTNVPLRLRRVELAINAGDTNTAASDLQELKRLSPKNAEASIFRIYLLIQARDLKAAMAEVDAVLAEHEKNPQALIYKGIIHMEQKEDDKAIEAFSDVLKVDPYNMIAIRNRAIVSLRAGELNDAKKDYEMMLAAMPRSHVVYYGLGEIAYKKGDRKEALANYEQYLRYAPRQGGPEFDEERKKIEGLVNELKSGK